MLLFSLLTLLIFNFALDEDPEKIRQLVPGILWVIFLLAGVLGLNKAFAQELENACMSGLLLTPVDRGTIFIGKMLGTTLFLLMVQFFTIPLFLVFFNIEIVNTYWNLLLIVFISTLGFSSLGTLLSGMTATLRGREVLLPVLLFPLMVPHLLSVVKITDYIFFGGMWESVEHWYKLLFGFDIIIGILAYLVFEYVVEE